MDIVDSTQKKAVFILGSKGIPANYGGFETFVENLTLNKIDSTIQYYVSCQYPPDKYLEGMHEHNGAKCFHIMVPQIGSSRAVYYDWKSLKWTLNFIKVNRIKNAVIMVCACRIGPIIALKKNCIKKLGARLFINPDGHEWMRSKWNAVIRKYWRYSEKMCVKFADLLICDSKNIEDYIRAEYAKYNPQTIYIAYGTDTRKSTLADDASQIVEWYEKWDLSPGQYFLNIARFVPENNYEIIIREFMESNTDKSLVIISNIKGNKYYEKLKKKFKFERDRRIKIVDSIYDQELLKKIRENAFGYIHGHSVGGTNPSLVEALGVIDINLLYDSCFNNEVGKKGALYWNAEEGNLGRLIEKTNKMDLCEIKELGFEAHRRIEEFYLWKHICEVYENVLQQMI